MPLPRHYVLGRRSKRASARRRLRRDQEPVTTWDGTEADLYEPRSTQGHTGDCPHCSPPPVDES